MNVPMVTEDDLRNFHRKHFPTAPAPSSLFAGIVESGYQNYEDDEQYYEDDGLGYYTDGVERTLTDEQIAMFRHSEIQTLLKERELQAEAEDESILDEEASTSGGGGNKVTGGVHREQSVTPSDIPNFGGSPPPTPKLKSKKRKNKKRKRNTEDVGKSEEEEGITYRRIAREMDEQANIAVELDY